MFMATATKQWTLEEVHSLPDDGNKYELVRGELFVTPAPAFRHQTVIARLARLLDPYVSSEGLGLVFQARAVMRVDGSEVEPDLMVRQPGPDNRIPWEQVPVPILVVEVFSSSTRRRDQTKKRVLYLDTGVQEYWMIDPERLSITSVVNGREDVVSSVLMTWHPAGASSAFAFDVAQIFG